MFTRLRQSPDYKGIAAARDNLIAYAAKQLQLPAIHLCLNEGSGNPASHLTLITVYGAFIFELQITNYRN